MTAQAKVTILNVEDYAASREAVTQLLQDAGYEVIEAATGGEALNQIAAARPQLVLLDVNLPDLSGYEVCRRIKSDPATASTLVLQTSGQYQRSEDKVRGLESGADGYLVKPVGKAELLATVNALLRLQRAEERANAVGQGLRGLAAASLVINSTLSLNDVLQVITEQARLIIGAHQSVTSLSVAQDWAQAISTVSLSEKYAAWREYHTPPDGIGIYKLVCRTNSTMRLTQAELEANPAFRRFGAEAGKHPPMRGWLAAPLVGRDGSNLGLVQLSDKYAGEFTAEDEAILVQLAQMASVAIENARLYADAQAARAAAEEADQRKDEFLAMLAHELRNPLAPIRNAVLLLRTPEASEAQRDHARDLIDRQVDHLTRLVDDLLDVSRITRGKITLHKEPVTLAAIFTSAVEASRPLIDARRHHFFTSLPGEEVTVEGDATRLAQIVSNLLTNAAKYTDPGGAVWLTGAVEDGQAVVRVRDTGIGMTPELLPRVFDLFTQAERTLDRSQGGLGVGLTLVRRLVEMHGGRIEAASEGPGKGSIFTVRLPALNAAQHVGAVGQDEGQRAQAEQSEQTASAATAALRVLVVDDNEDSAESLSLIFSLKGHEVRTAFDGPAALEEAARFAPDVAVLDVGLPGMDGYEVARRLRAMPAMGRTLIVALTGYGQDQDRRLAEEAGFDHHLVKPVNFTALLDLVAAHQAARGATATPAPA